jgi:hypothetical protein
VPLRSRVLSWAAKVRFAAFALPFSAWISNGSKRGINGETGDLRLRWMSGSRVCWSVRLQDKRGNVDPIGPGFVGEAMARAILACRPVLADAVGGWLIDSPYEPDVLVGLASPRSICYCTCAS